MKSNTTSKNPANSSLTNNNHFITHLRDTLLRGGRLTKYKGQLASFAPSLSTAICTPTLELGQQIGNAIGAQTRKLATGALTAAMLVVAPAALISTGAQAGSCTGAAGTYTCTGAAVPSEAAVGFSVASPGPGPITVTNDGTFGLNTTPANINAANFIVTIGSVGGLSVDLGAANITSTRGAIRVDNQGLDGDTTFRSTGTLTSGPTASSSAVLVGSFRNVDGGDVYATVNNVTQTTPSRTTALQVINQGDGSVTVVTQAGGMVDASLATGNGIEAYNQAPSTDITVTANGDVMGGGNAVYVRNRAAVSAGATSITTNGVITGGNFNGIWANNVGITTTTLDITANNTVTGNYGINTRHMGTGAQTITTTAAVTGKGGIGIFAYNQAAGNTTDLTVVASGDVSGAGNYGAIVTYNYGSGATVITATGIVDGDTDLNMQGFGIRAANHGTSLSITTGSNAVSGGASGIFAHNTGTGATSITVNGVVTGGGQGAGIFNNTVNASTITLNSGAAVSATSGDAIIDTNGATSLILNTGSSVTGNILLGGGNDAINLAGGDFSGVTVFNGEGGVNDSLIFSGSDGVFDQSLMTNVEEVTIDNGSGMGLSFEGDAFDASGLTGSLLTVQNGGILNATNGFALTGNLVNSSGIVSMQNGAIDAPATISGDYTGGGQLLVDVDTSTDSADTLVLQGANSSGTTSVSVNDIAAIGAATGNDIVIIDDTATGAAIFILDAPVVNGVFLYNALNEVNDDWVLSTEVAGGGPAFTAIASAYEHLASGLFILNTLPTLQERITGRNSQQASASSGASSGDLAQTPTGFWVRAVGGSQKQNNNNSSTAARYDTDYKQIKLGIDQLLKQTNTGSLIGGININSGSADTDVSATAGNSNIDTDGYGIGLSATWYDNEGLYIDGQVQKNWYELDLAASGVGGGASAVDGDGYSASIEVGQRIDIGQSSSLFMTPQVQLGYSKISIDELIGPNAEQVKLIQDESLKLRLGISLDSYTTEQDTRSHVYAIANIVYEFNDKRSVNVSGFDLSSSVDDWSGELGAGGSYNWDDDYSLYGEIKANTSLNKIGDNNGYEGRIGVRINF
ncbi:autotransporter outer membrane beta-barrel domain-containing protein [Candidatus Thioglobus sp.]|uniref:autotransporter outer membrane beta-barrel domain-containing protein n=1 Tax=Candidatus Thioglobus sp. TaxID=2026721 RepID=UPI003D11B0A8